MIDIGDFAKPIIADKPGAYFRFGMNEPSQCAKVLRKMADDIAAGKILIQKVQTGQVAQFDEYLMQAICVEVICVEFAEREGI